VRAVSLDAFSAAFSGGSDVLASVPKIPPTPAPAIAGVLAGLLPGGVPEIQFPALPALDAGGILAGLTSDAAPVIPWPDLHGLYGEFVEAASAVSARVLRGALRNVTKETGNGQ
jgi:hypothetical protein